jgi:beta-1,4-mannosyl-glycoprotein beta-1,4-N-acetylglucosaminyltransferase
MPTYPLIDYFLYHNEIQLLELRYHVLQHHVDRFVIAESNQTFQGKPREWCAEQHIRQLGLPLQRFDIIQVDVSDVARFTNDLDRQDAVQAGRDTEVLIWTRQRLQRDALLSRISQYSTDSVFILGDVDEIPNPAGLQFVAEMLHQHRDYVLKLPLVLLEGTADCQLTDEHGKTVWWDRSLLMCRYPQLALATPTEMRSERTAEFQTGHAVQDNQRAENLGWHFTWMGDTQAKVTKIQSCAHGANPSSINNISAETLQEVSQAIGSRFQIKHKFRRATYDVGQLPKEIWQLPRVREFLLPQHREPSERSSVPASQNFVSRVLDAGGSIAPLLVPSNATNGTGLFNPSILVDHGRALVNIRHCQYTLFHAEQRRFEHEWGPLLYLHPENDCTLTTTNYFGELDSDLSLRDVKAVDTSMLDVKPLWEFVGLEDVRMVKWQDRIFYCGVRRDTTTNGQGRMELSEIDIDGAAPREISRQRMPAPGTDQSYCEKNWMPVLDQPYTFVKWCNPTEVVRYDPDTRSTQQIHLGQYQSLPYDLRGGSQVLTLGDRRIAITHLAFLDRSESGRKDGTYRHVLVTWDQHWNVIKYGQPFSFLDARIEFCCGMAQQGDHILMTFGVQDNAAYVLTVPMEFFQRWIDE